MICDKINLVFNKMEETFQFYTLDWSSLVLLFFLSFFLSYFSLQQIFSNGFSVISQPISIKFGMRRTGRIFFKSIEPGVGIRRGLKVLLCFIKGKTLYTVRRDKNFT